MRLAIKSFRELHSLVYARICLLVRIVVEVPVLNIYMPVRRMA
jgi:hypothetical protein